MSSTFAGLADRETKPGKPRLDIKPGTDGDDPTEFNFQYKLYNDIAFMGNFNISIAVGDNVDVSKQQTIHSTIGYLKDFLNENVHLLQRDPVDRNGIVLSLTPNNVKSQVTVISVGDSLFDESDLDQDAINLCFYIQSEASGSFLSVGAGIFETCLVRLRELAREFDYFTWGEPRRGTTTVPDQNVTEGATATFTPPSWNDGPDGVGGTVTNSVWLENGEVIRPFAPGLQNLVLSNVTLDMDGNVYQVRVTSSAASPPSTDIGDAYRHSNIGTLTVTP